MRRPDLKKGEIKGYLPQKNDGRSLALEEEWVVMMFRVYSHFKTLIHRFYEMLDVTC